MSGPKVNDQPELNRPTLKSCLPLETLHLKHTFLNIKLKYGPTFRKSNFLSKADWWQLTEMMDKGIPLSYDQDLNSAPPNL